MNTTEILDTATQLANQFRELQSCKSYFESRIAELTRQNDAIVHEIERDRCKYKERARLATQLAAIRRERRACKDWMCVNEPYFQWLGTDNGTKMNAAIANLIGVGRRVKKAKEQRNENH